MVGNRLTGIGDNGETSISSIIVNASPPIVSGVSSNMSTEDSTESVKANSPILIDNYPTSAGLL